MRRIITALAAFVLLLAAGLAYSQSLADLAKKEKERRQKITAEGKVITNNDAAKYKAGAVTTASLPGPAASTKSDADKSGLEAEGASKAVKATLDEPVDFQGRPESYWRQTMGDAHRRVQNLENEANVLILKLADLQNQFYRESSGFRQQDIQKEIQKTLYEQDRNKEDLAKARDQLQELEKQARKDGALPGWLIPKIP